MNKQKATEDSETIRKRVIAARKRQQIRLNTQKGIFHNAMLTPQLMKTHCQVDHAGQHLLQQAMDKLKLSTRAYTRILKVARTIADLTCSNNIHPQHLAEAIQYRNLDRTY